MNTHKNIKQLSKIPAVSVIIPIYNVEPYLRQCLDSLINQTLQNIEIICVNDASYDKSIDILKEYAKKDKRIRVYNHIKNRKTGYCRNCGMAKARADYVFFLDSDDFIKPETLKNIYKKIKSAKADICQFLASNYDNETQKITNQVGQIFDIIREKKYKTYDYKCNPLLLFNHVETWKKLYRKQFLLDNDIKFPTKTYFEDTLVHIKSMMLAQKICFDDNHYIYYRKNRKGQMTEDSAETDKFLDVFNYINGAEKFFKEHGVWEEIKNYYYTFAVGRICGYYVRCNDLTKVKFAQKVKKWCTNKKILEIQASAQDKFGLFSTILKNSPQQTKE